MLTLSVCLILDLALVVRCQQMALVQEHSECAKEVKISDAGIEILSRHYSLPVEGSTTTSPTKKLLSYMRYDGIAEARRALIESDGVQKTEKLAECVHEKVDRFRFSRQPPHACGVSVGISPAGMERLYQVFKKAKVNERDVKRQNHEYRKNFLSNVRKAAKNLEETDKDKAGEWSQCVDKARMRQRFQRSLPDSALDSVDSED